MNDSEDPKTVSKPSWDSSQLHMRTTCVRGSMTSLYGCLRNLLTTRHSLNTVYSFDDPSPRVPTFAFGGPSGVQAAAGTPGPQTRSQALSGAIAAPPATATSASVSLTASTVPRPPPLTPDESKRFIFAPEMIDS
eukprot:2912795-Pleurochrysis_carterae.AAC.1